MLDVKKTYEIYNEKIKTNKQVMNGIGLMLGTESLIQFTILQTIAHNTQSGISAQMLARVGLDEELIIIILKEAEQNNLIEKRQDKYFITDNGKSVVIASYFKGLENLG